MKNKTFNISLQKEVVVVSLFLVSTLLHFFFGEYSFDLTDLSSVQISRATLDAADVSKRISFFYKLLGLFLLLMLVVYCLVFFAKKKWGIHPNQEKALILLAITGFLLRISSVYGIQCDNGANLITGFFVAVIGLSILSRHRNLFRIATNFTFFFGVAIMSMITLGALLFLFNSNQFVQENSSLLFFVLLLVSIGLTAVIKQKKRLKLRMLFLYSTPLCLVPILIFISIELLFYFKLHHDIFIPFKWIFIGLWTLLAIGIWGFLKLKKPTFSVTSLVHIFYAPSALLVFLLFTQYSPILAHPKEMFELANPAIAQMRLFAFAEIPIVDFMSSHMLSEQFYGFIYHLIFGFDGGLDFLSYQFFYNTIFYFIVYVFLKKVFNSGALALLFLIAFPLVSSLFYTHLFSSVLIFFIVQNILNSQTVKHYYLLGTLLVIMCFWRLDLGVSTIMSAIVYILIGFFVSRKKIEFLTLLKAVGIFGATCLFGVLIVLFFREREDVLVNVNNFFHYISANQAHGLSVVARNYGQQFFMHHILFPMGSILTLLFSIYTLRSRGKELTSAAKYALNASIFLFLVYLANFQRGLVRHSFAEHTDSFLTSTFFIALALFIFSQIKHNVEPWKRYVYLFSSSFAIIFMLKYFAIDKNRSGLDQFLEKTTLANFDKKITSENYKGRITGKKEFSENNFVDLKRFLDGFISDEQTFLDFSNTPMLYYYCQRKVPSYFCQNLQNIVDDYLQLEQIKRIDPAQIPVVIYSNSPKNWWDNTDGVSNIMRQYLLAEHIHKNYKPFALINKHSVWVSKASELDNLGYQFDEDLNVPQTFNYQEAGWLINNYIEKELSNAFEKLELNKDRLQIKGNKVILSTDNLGVELTNLFIKIKLEKSVDNQDLKIEFFSKEQLLGSNVFRTRSKELEYMMPLSNHYLWSAESVSVIKALGNESCKIMDVQLFKDIRDEY